jgi:hypothetical protein
VILDFTDKTVFEKTVPGEKVICQNDLLQKSLGPKEAPTGGSPQGITKRRGGFQRF